MKRITPLLFAAILAPASWAQEPFLAKNEFVTITKADFEAEVARLQPEQQGALRASPERLPGFIENILVIRTLAAQARRANLDQSASAKAEIQAVVDRALAQRRLDQHDATLQVPDLSKRAREIYLSDPKQYEEKALYNASHVMVDFKCRTPEAALSRAEEARKALMGGVPLPDVVSQYSDDPTARSNQGKLGWRSYDVLNPTLQELLPTMKKGQVSEPVSSNFGYHVVVLHDVKPGRPRPFEEVKDGIIEKLKLDYVKTQRQQLVNKITTDPAIQVNIHEITALATAVRPATPGEPLSPALSGAAPPAAQSPALVPSAPAAPGATPPK